MAARSRERRARLRCRTSEWLAALCDRLFRIERWARALRMDALAVLDERGQVDETFAAREGISVRDAAMMLDTARALESQPSRPKTS